VVRYLSDEWFDEAARLLAPAPAGGEPGFVLQQVVTDQTPGEAPTETSWYVVVCDGAAHLGRGRHPRADVTFSCDAATAWEIQQGGLSAQAAFMAGRLRLGGDASTLLANRAALEALDDQLAPLRAATTR